MKKNEKGLYTTSFRYQGKRYYVRAKTERELWKKVAQKQQDLEAGKIIVNGNTTVAHWSQEWLETYKKDSVRKGAYERYARILRNHLNANIGNMRMQDVRSVHLQKIINAQAGQSKDTVKKTMQTIQMVFKRARQNKIIAFDPSEDLQLPATTAGKSRRALTDTERKYILQLAETHPAGTWIKMMLYCGLRPAETITLCWKGIIGLDTDKPRVCVQTALEARTGEYKAPKNEAGVRKIPIPAIYANELRRLRPANSAFCPVFARADGRPHTQTTIRRLWNKFRDALDILMGAQTITRTARNHKPQQVIVVHAVASDLVPYCLRHTFCTDLQAAGVPINVARELMGHADLSTTARIYTHSTDIAIDAAENAMNLFANGATKGATDAGA